MTNSSTDNVRDAALKKIVELAHHHNISADEIAVQLTHAALPGKDKGVVGKLLGYIGGIFIFSGICLLISFLWDDIGSAQRVILTFGVGLTAFIMGAASIKDSRFEKTATPLFLVSAFLQPFGLFVFLSEYIPESGDPVLAVLLVFGMMTLQQGLAFWSLKRTSLLFFTLVFWNSFIGTAMDWLDLDGELVGLAIGFSMISLSWAIGKTEHRSITPLWYFLGAIILLASYWSLVEGGVLDVSYLALNGFMIYLSIKAASRTLLFVSVPGIIVLYELFCL